MVQFNAYGFNHDIYSDFYFTSFNLWSMQCIIQKKKHVLCHDGIIAIIYYLYYNLSLSLYWAISATFLIIQMHFA